MSQSKVTNYFNVRKKLPDQHAVKRRKVLTDANPVGQTVTKVDEDEPLKQKVVVVENETTDVVKTESSVAPKTPTSVSTANNKRSSKRNTKETAVTPSNDEKTEENVRFTIGSGNPTPSSAKKKLDMGSKGASTRARKNVEFTKMSQLSPKKKLQPEVPSSMKSEEFKVPTPVKELIGARRPLPTRESVPKNLFGDVSDSTLDVGARKRRGMRAEIENATAIAKKLTPEEIKARLGTKNKSVDFKAKLKNLINETKKVEEVKKKRLPAKLMTPTKVFFNTFFKICFLIQYQFLFTFYNLFIFLDWI